MIQDIQPHRYDLQYQIREIKDDDFLVIADEKKNVYLKENAIPRCRDFPDLSKEDCRYLFSIDDESYFGCLTIISDLDYVPLRQQFPLLDNREAFALCTAYHLLTWYRSNRYCGRCTSELKPHPTERALYCERCGRNIYPTISPAVIIGVINGDKILISHYAGRNYKGAALLAGFCEIGEEAEETCRREVMEETGLKIKDIRYFASQPWGIENDLLMGYFARLDGDDRIQVDENELADAMWVNREELPERSDLKSLTATMIEAFRTGRIV